VFLLLGGEKATEGQRFQQFTREEALCTRSAGNFHVPGQWTGALADRGDVPRRSFLYESRTSMNGFFPTLPKTRRLGNRRRTRETNTDKRNGKRRKRRMKAKSEK
jgi:hypothetical protein